MAPSPPRVMIFWEDQLAQELQVAFKRIRQYVSPHPSVILESFSVRGNTNFKAEVPSQWPLLHKQGRPLQERTTRTQGYDLLLCIADADAAQQITPSLQKFPEAGESLEWLKEAEARWTEELRASLVGEPFLAERIYGFFLRWSKESVFSACYDQEGVLKALGDGTVTPEQRLSLQEGLSACKPPLDEVLPADFVERYRHPKECAYALLRVFKKNPRKKNDPLVQTGLQEFPRLTSSNEALVERIPDFKRISQRLDAILESLTETPA